MDALDVEDTWGGDAARLFAVGIALGGVAGLLLGSAIGLALGRRRATALRHLLAEVLRRSDRIDFELLAQ